MLNVQNQEKSYRENHFNDQFLVSFLAAQVKRSKEGQVDLVSPNSILSKMNVRVSR